MKIISIIIKDLKIILSDKKALAIMIVMPIVLTTILSMALKGSFISGEDNNIKTVNIAIVKLYDENMDSQMFKTALNNNIISQGMGDKTLKELIDSGNSINPEEMIFEDFLNSKEVSEIINYRLEKEEKAMELLNNGEVSAVLLFPDKFIYDMKINLLTPFRNNVEIKVITHPDRNIDGQIVKSVIEAYSNAMSSIIIGKNVIIESVMANNISYDSISNMEDTMEKMNKLIKDINVNIDNVVVEGKKNISSADYYAVAMMTMFILFAAGQGGRMLLEEKDNLTYQRMIVAGTSSLGILCGKLITIFLIAIFQIVTMIIFSHYALKVQWGNLNSVILISLSAAFSVAGLGTFIGAISYKAGNYKIANIFESAIIQCMALLGGSFFPIEVLPKIMQNLSFLSINGIALRSYLKVLIGSGTKDVINNIFILNIIGLLFSILAIIVLNRKEGYNAKYNKTTDIKA
ncbi:ABC-2 type transport system permease protein [Sedimentibacter acidaminivorans]|uniref:ABC-2 type transport system permease protein n=1 Tax=Sedimentibacter acidaminivorans TaxID=913099 RepID=A0ABS4GEQ9_9FIRM|nr:ABC transporter permease [Sedimentibacter acidaminivorans]MBP1926185.1 ABC-2 type transport system permease protein [Sedimentibacter acidaminivorans]